MLPNTNQIIPQAAFSPSSRNEPTVEVLSKWIRCTDELEARIREQVSMQAFPDSMVLVVNDIDGNDPEHEMLLDRLTLAGAIILSADSPEEFQRLRLNPIEFAKLQLSAMRTNTMEINPTTPGFPEEYRKFATAISPLSVEELREIIGD